MENGLETITENKARNIYRKFEGVHNTYKGFGVSLFLAMNEPRGFILLLFSLDL